MSLICKNCQYERPNNYTRADKTCPLCHAIYDIGDVMRISQPPTALDATTPQKPASIDLAKPTQNYSAAKSIELADTRSWRVQLFKNGNPIESRLQRLYKSHGPFVIDKYRLDWLVSAEVVRDASTVTTQSKSEGATSTKTGSLAGRAVVGGLIAGPAGAIIGGGSAKTHTSTSTTSTQSINVSIYISLLFKGDTSPIKIQLFDEASFQQVLACVGQKEWSQSELDNAKEESRLWHNEESLKAAKRRYANAYLWHVFFGVFSASVVPLFFLGGAFMSYIFAIIAAFFLAGTASAHSCDQRGCSFDKKEGVDISFFGLGSGLYAVIVVMLVIWSSFYFWNKSDKEESASAEKVRWERELQESYNKPKLSPDAVPCSSLEEWSKSQPLNSEQRARGMQYAKDHGNCY